MSLKLYSLFFLLILISSCSNNANKSKAVQAVGSNEDSITAIDIKYYPAFLNRSVLHFDRKSGSAVFRVDTTVKDYHEVPKQPLSFALNGTETTFPTNHFWNESFIQSLRDTTHNIVRDGMHVWVIYSKGTVIDSVDLGNSRSARVDSVLLGQFNYLNQIAEDKAMKEYLKNIKDYL